MRTWVALLALGVVTGCGGNTTTKPLPLDEQCRVICQTAKGQCPSDCQTRCLDYAKSRTCGAARIAFWYCAATVSDAACYYPDTFLISTTAVSEQQCSSQLDANNQCVCANQGLIKTCGP